MREAAPACIPWLEDRGYPENEPETVPSENEYRLVLHSTQALLIVNVLKASLLVI